MSVDLIWLSEASNNLPNWPLGATHAVSPTPRAIARLVEHSAPGPDERSWLFWHSHLGPPPPDRVQRALSLPGDLWHAGLKLGMSGLPDTIDFVTPTWMLNADPDPDIEASSWRLSLHACLVKSKVLRYMGGPHPTFRTLEGAALELGHRYIRSGVMMRHVPWLIESRQPSQPDIPFEDELRFNHYRWGKSWALWTVFRAVWSGYVPPLAAAKALGHVWRDTHPRDPSPYPHSPSAITASSDAAVSVLIPTIDRYPYLHKVLDQLENQTHRPHEVIVVDQTPVERRDTTLEVHHRNLPLKVIVLQKAGQCTSRNEGLRQATGDYVLFIDDDDEVEPDLIALHLQNLARFGAKVSCGAAHEIGSGALPEDFTFTRTSDVFPTNNALICKSVLLDSGLFDLAYDQGQHADGDLGTRIYLSGYTMMYNPTVGVIHHHASVGGLRTHKARMFTYASSRKSLTIRHLPHVSDLYLAHRYYSPRQIRESMWLWAFGTFSVRGALIKRILKIGIGLLLLPDTWRRIRRTNAEANDMLSRFPVIPRLPPS